MFKGPENTENMLCLHTLVSVTDALTRTCLQTALILLTSLVEKYKLQNSGQFLIRLGLFQSNSPPIVRNLLRPDTDPVPNT